LLLGKYDEEVLNYVRKLRESGAILNRQILIAGAKGILQQKAKNLLRENGGT
jgi:molybdopterin/thiamine biosynthesis adenylyltransferase